MSPEEGYDELKTEVNRVVNESELNMAVSAMILIDVALMLLVRVGGAFYALKQFSVVMTQALDLAPKREVELHGGRLN